MPDSMNPERAFASPLLVAQDLGWMQTMMERVRAYLASREDLRTCASPDVHGGRESDGRAHRVVIIRPQPLFTEPLLSVVGFFGEVRPGAATVEAIHKADEELIMEFPQFGGLLSYSSLQLPSGQWGNFAIFIDEQARDAWGRNERHMTVVKELASKHYRSIRIHHARLLGSLDSPSLQIERTKYYSYDNQLTWRAVREAS